MTSWESEAVTSWESEVVAYVLHNGGFILCIYNIHLKADNITDLQTVMKQKASHVTLAQHVWLYILHILYSV